MLNLKTKKMQAPPWLWIWIINYITIFPDWYNHFIGSMRTLVILDSLDQPYSSPFGRLVLTPTILEVLPTTVLIIGIIAIFIPWLRAKKIERDHNLSVISPDYPSDTIKELLSFIQHNTSKIKIKAQLADLQRIAKIYPDGYLRSAIAIFGGLVRIWRINKEEGKAIILHELAHHYHRDAMIVGAGSPLVKITQKWIYVTIIIALALWFIEIIRVFDKNQLNLNFLDQLLETTTQFITVIIPGFISILFSVFIWTIALFIVPIIGIWCAELSADRFAIENEETKGAFLGWIARQQGAHRIIDWFWRYISHPPMILRIWMARNASHWYSLLILLILFPMAYIVRLIFLIIWSIFSHLNGGFKLGQLTEEIPKWIGFYFDSLEITFTIFGIALTVWLLIIIVLNRLKEGFWTIFPLHQCALYGIIILGLCSPILFDHFLSDSNNNSCQGRNTIVVTDQIKYRAGEIIKVRYSGMSGNIQDWINIVKKNADANDWGNWEYTKGKTDGEISFIIQKPGIYEVRAFFAWPTCGFKIQAQHIFTVTEPR